MAKRSARREAADFAASLPEEYLQCRSLGHNWFPFTARWAGGVQRCYESILRCARCGSERKQRISTRGAVLANNYDYADGYTRQGYGRMTGDGRDQLRLESVTRVLNEAEER